MIEVWKSIIGYEDLYFVSNKGFIKNAKNVLTNYRSVERNYYIRDLSKNGKVKRFFVHRLVLETFYPRDGYNRKFLDVNHKDGNTINNCLENLEWVTRSENMKHAFRIGLISHKEEKHNNAKLKKDNVLAILEMLDKKVKRKHIANIFNISVATIHDIAIHRSWKTVCNEYTNS